MNVTVFVYQFPNSTHCIVKKKLLPYLIYHCLQDHFHCSVTHAAKRYYSVASHPASLPYGLAVLLTVLVILGVY